MFEFQRPIFYFLAEKVNISQPIVENEFDWNDQQQGNMLGAYFYGYASGMPVAGWWSTRFGPTKTTLVSMALGTLLTFVYPFLISVPNMGFELGFAARVILGFVHSPNFPTVQGRVRQAPVLFLQIRLSEPSN